MLACVCVSEHSNKLIITHILICGDGTPRNGKRLFRRPLL
jgi:hypothetical protein